MTFSTLKMLEPPVCLLACILMQVVCVDRTFYGHVITGSIAVFTHPRPSWKWLAEPQPHTGTPRQGQWSARSRASSVGGYTFPATCLSAAPHRCIHLISWHLS